MSAMEDMLGNMLKKALPAEVLEMLAPEKVREFGEKINTFLQEVRSGQDAINARLDRIDERLANGDGNH